MSYSDLLHLYSSASRRRAALSILRPPIAYTNGYYLHLVSPSNLCEWDPEKSRPARLSDLYHAIATVEIGKYRYRYRVCQSCAKLPELKEAARVTKDNKDTNE